MANNYEREAERARERFLTFDRDRLIAFHRLRHDESYMYLSYLNRETRIGRGNGIIESRDDRGDFRPVGFNGVLTIYDYLCYSSSEAVKPVMSGTWASVGELGGIIGSYHDTSLRDAEEMHRLAGKTSELRRACEKLGGTPSGLKGDVSYILPVFEDLTVLFRYWDGDDEFPPDARILPDRNTLQLMHYETVWYMMIDIKEHLFADL